MHTENAIVADTFVTATARRHFTDLLGADRADLLASREVALPRQHRPAVSNRAALASPPGIRA